MKEQQTETVTIPLDDLLWLILGTQETGVSCNPVPLRTASVLQHKLVGKELYKLEFDNVDGTQSKLPILWWRKDWVNASSTYAKQKAYQDKERLDRWLFAANLSMITKAIMNKTHVTEQHAQSMATMMLKAPDASAVIHGFFGVAKLKTTLEELE